jgi:pyrroloquinoline quinone biosynthesis protein D
MDLLLVPERVVTLNTTAGAVLGLCDGTRTVSAIRQALEARYEGPELGADLGAFLAAARRERWLT